MSEAPFFGAGTGLDARLRGWADGSVVRRALVLLLQLLPVVVGAIALPAALGGSVAARAVFGTAVAAALGYKAVDVRIARREQRR